MTATRKLTQILVLGAAVSWVPAEPSHARDANGASAIKDVLACATYLDAFSKTKSAT